MPPQTLIPREGCFCFPEPISKTNYMIKYLAIVGLLTAAQPFLVANSQTPQTEAITLSGSVSGYRILAGRPITYCRKTRGREFKKVYGTHYCLLEHAGRNRRYTVHYGFRSTCSPWGCRSELLAARNRNTNSGTIRRSGLHHRRQDAQAIQLQG
jgi:hypothetical protein